MNATTLSRFNSRSFEELIHALSFAELGMGTVFPPGPDGARDYIFEGKIQKPKGKPWSGYVIVQAKFRENPKGNETDLTWLKNQIEKERLKFSNSHRNLRRPEYYILATNISLSGADTVTKTGIKRQGGHTKISNVLESWKNQLGLKDFQLWPKDVIQALLAGHGDIRTNFAQYVTVGDVLTEVLNEFAAKKEEFGKIIRRSLKRRIAADQFIALNEAGSVDQKRIQTSRVFFDLPIVHKKRSDSQLKLRDAAENIDFLRSVIEQSKTKFCGGMASDSLPEENLKYSNLIVLLGGPGHGKSTTGLFAAQLYRAAILKDDPTVSVDPNLRDVIPEILSRAEAQGLPSEFPRRLPLHVSLPTYADYLSARPNEEAQSLLAYITRQIGRDGDGEVKTADVRAWLARYPSLIVLDGLDEVPPSGERPAVIEAITYFLSEMADVKADVMIVVTSRPQGYNKDLDPRYWAHWHLAELDEKRALAYAEALSLAQYPEETERREKIRESLTRAMRQPATARLMISPLQVTIMHVIVDGGGSAPVGRWNLFNEYFNVLKKREKSKRGDTHDILEKNLDHLDPVHYRSGLILQTESETSGGAGASFTLGRFRGMIDSYLKAIGYAEEPRLKRSDDLSRLALHRLVLLSMRQQGRTDDEGLISFDVRSLQEFMAAAELTTESENLNGDRRPTIEDRLIQVAGTAHWHHVFLIAASRCFSDTALHYLRSSIVSIPRALETSEPYFLSRKGAQLALDMLADGIASNHPISRAKLAEHALELLDLGPDNYDKRLAGVRSSETAPLFDHRLKSRLAEGRSAAAQSAWKLLLQLCEIEPQTFLPLAESLWPMEADHGLEILSAIKSDLHRSPPSLPSAALWKKAVYAIKMSDPLDVYSKLQMALYGDEGKVEQKVDVNEILFNNLRIPFDTRVTVPLLTKLNPLAQAHFFPLHVMSLYLEDQNVSTWHPNWMVYASIAQFARTPSVQTLCICLDSIIATNTLSYLKMERLPLPWPIEMLVGTATRNDTLTQFREIAADGRFGDEDDWKCAELRWCEFGITMADITAIEDEIPFGKNIRDVGAPFFTISQDDSAKYDNYIRTIVDIIYNVKNKNLHRQILNSIYFSLAITDENARLSDAQLVEIIRLGEQNHPIWIESLNHFSEKAWGDERLVAEINSKIFDSRVISRRIFNLNIDAIIAAFNKYPYNKNLLVAILIIMIERQDKSELTKLSSAAFVCDPLDSKDVRWVVAAFGVLQELSSDNISVAKLVHLSNNSVSINLLQRLFMSKILSQGQRELLITELIKKFEGTAPDEAKKFCPMLKRTLDARKSGLADVSIWVNKLRLPEDAFAAMEPRGLEINGMRRPHP